MNTLHLTPERVVKVVGDPAVYQAAPFLNPMKDSALAAASRFRGCKNCQKPAFARAARAMGGAFARLTLEADPDLYPLLKQAIFNILNVRDAELVIISFIDKFGKKRDLTF